MSKNITAKIRELLTPEDLKIFEGAVESLIDAKVKSKLSSLIQLKESELKKSYDTAAEEYVKKAVGEKLVVETAKLVKTYDKKLELLEKKVVTKLDSYLDHVIKEQISDDVLTKIAINETLMPVVEGIRSVFMENHLKIDSKAQSVVDTLKTQLSQAKESLDEAVTSRLKLESELEKSAVYLLMAEKTSGLKPSDKQKVVEMFKGKDFDDVEKNIDNYLDLIKESNSFSNNAKKSINTKKKVSAINESTVVDSLKDKVKDDSFSQSKLPSINAIANQYLK